MKKSKGIRMAAAWITAVCLALPGTAVGAAGTSSAPQTAGTDSGTLEEQLARVTKERDELKAKVGELTKEVEELKNGQAESAEPKPALPDNVAGADTTVTYSDAATVRLVQQALNAAGYNCGNPDGVPGAKTAEQISAYETAKGLTVNGAVTDQLLQSLGIADQVAAQAKQEAQKGQYSADYSYQQLARNPDAYLNQKVKFSGEVLQADNGDPSYIRLAINSDYDSVLFVTFDPDIIDYNLLENDQVTVYGVDLGEYTYETVLGASVTIPWVQADMIEISS